jgi:class 3 adenylate cyclase
MNADAVLEELAHAITPVLPLLARCESEEEPGLWQDPRVWRAFARRLISDSHYTRAFELARAGLARGDDPELRYLSALALARGGNLSRAAEYAYALLPTLAPGPLLEETHSLLGRISKDRYSRVADPLLRGCLARAAAEQYELAYLSSGDSFPGINAATLWLLAGEAARARSLSEQVEERARDRLTEAPADYWLLATLGEAAVIAGDPGAAAGWYRRAASAAAGRLGDLAAMRRNLQLLAERVEVAPELLELLDTGRVVVFAGHMIDHPGRHASGRAMRFPADRLLESFVRGAIEERLEALQARVGFCSVACGADVLFAEAMLRRGAELHVVMPYDPEEFFGTSVDFGLTEMIGWRRRSEALLRHATEVHHVTREPFLGDVVLLDLNRRVTQGLAIVRAAHLGTEPHGLVLMEPGAEPLLGGTADFASQWRARGRELSVIDLARLRCQAGHSRRESLPASVSPPPAATAAPGRVGREVRVMLFADVKDFSKLREEQGPTFVVEFLRRVAEVIESAAEPPEFRNTWGDGLFLVFRSVVAAAEFAMRLLERIAEVDWAALQLPADTAVRIGIHAGPVYPYEDPVIARQNYFGSHVNRAARVEPVTVPGCAFTSEQFAALLALEGGHAFVCEYVAVEDLAKGFDRCALYRLRRR